jgi:ribonuclease D
MNLIATTEELAAACQRLSSPYVTVDTESCATTYYLLCLVQMASPAEAVLVDPLAPGIDLQPFFWLMADERQKVFHSPPDVEMSGSAGHHP